MKAAIYARKSTDDNDRDAENKSVTRQVEQAKKYIASKGWTASDDHVYLDDGISGFEFKKRPSLLRMLNHLKQFDVIVMSELSRLGREQTQTSQVLAEVYAKGKKVFFYLTDEELKFKTAVDKFMVGAVAFGAELEREKAAQRSLDALARKAAKGFNAGGSCYGYDNVPVYAVAANGEQVKSHTDYRINPEQAEVVRSIFRAYADGYGHTSIAKAMNGSSVEKGKRCCTLKRDLDAIRKRYFRGRTPTAPQRGKRGTGSWAPTMIREVLYRSRYTGNVPFNGSIADRPDLRIVPDDLWQRVQARLKDVRATYIRDGGQWWGRPAAEKYLLTGMGRCAICGKSLSVIGGNNGSPGRREKSFYYGCSYHHARGDKVCANGHRARLGELNDAVLNAIKSQLTPEIIAYTMKEAEKRTAALLRQHPDKPRKLEAEARKLGKELKRFTNLIAEGKALDTVVSAIKQREERLKEIEREQAALLDKLPVLDAAEIRAKCGERISRFKELLDKDVPVARQALRKLLPQPLTISPAMVDDRRTLRFEGVTTLGPLFDPAFIKAWRPHGVARKAPDPTSPASPAGQLAVRLTGRRFHVPLRRRSASDGPDGRSVTMP
jgi:site-specific DNA recombinase